VRSPGRGNKQEGAGHGPDPVQSHSPFRGRSASARGGGVRPRPRDSRPSPLVVREPRRVGERRRRMVRMEIKGLLMDPVSNMPVVILRDTEKGHFLPIWVGIFQANAIALEMEKVSTPRPMTHDLLKTLLAELDAHVDRIVINDLRDNTFFARIHLTRGDSTLSVDSRPSDAIALALRSQAGIFVEEEVLEKSRNLRADGTEQDPDRLRKWLEEASPDELGKYRM